MSNLYVEINSIKGIKQASFNFPLENGIYAFVGGNGSGKSTALQAIAQLIRPQNALYALKANDFMSNSTVDFSYSLQEDKWFYDSVGTKKRWRNQIYSDSRRHYNENNINVNGMYEGSLFVGTRFQDSKQVDDLLNNNQITLSDLVSADEYVIKNMSYILHGDFDHYKTLKRLKNKQKREQLRLKNLPYFIDSIYGGLISQYRMSSGECLLVSLLHFIYNAIIRSSLPRNIPVLMLMDEIELALHPVAVSRFLDLVEQIITDYRNVISVLTTHAPEVIRRIKAANIYKLENEDGIVSMVNPCYPSYAIRELYQPDKYDILLLCEDILAKKMIERVLTNKNARKSKLIFVLPVGGWESVLRLQQDLITNNILGVGTKVISILDGDIQENCNRITAYSGLSKYFLPIPSIEKFLFDIIYNNSNKELKKIIGDKYFQLQSVEMLISQFNKDNPTLPKQANKSFYRFLLNDLKSRNISEDQFIISICDDIEKHINLNDFADKITLAMK